MKSRPLQLCQGTTGKAFSSLHLKAKPSSRLPPWQPLPQLLSSVAAHTPTLLLWCNHVKSFLC